MAKEHLRTLLASGHPDALPAGAQDWWKGFEAHAQPVDVEPWWC